jgi:PIF1-like helicase
MNKVEYFQEYPSRDQIPKNEYIFLSAPGGAGKTTVFKQLQAACRAKGVMIQCCAATTLAALLFDGAQTAHSLFNYPVVEEADIDPERIPECKLDHTQRLELLMESFHLMIEKSLKLSLESWKDGQNTNLFSFVLVIFIKFCLLLREDPNKKLLMHLFYHHLIGHILKKDIYLKI